MGAGILPVAYHKGNWYFLFARDYSKSEKYDFSDLNDEITHFFFIVYKVND